MDMSKFPKLPEPAPQPEPPAPKPTKEQIFVKPEAPAPEVKAPAPPTAAALPNGTLNSSSKIPDFQFAWSF